MFGTCPPNGKRLEIDADEFAGSALGQIAPLGGAHRLALWTFPIQTLVAFRRRAVRAYSLGTLYHDNCMDLRSRRHRNDSLSPRAFQIQIGLQHVRSSLLGGRSRGNSLLAPRCQFQPLDRTDDCKTLEAEYEGCRPQSESLARGTFAKFWHGLRVSSLEAKPLAKPLHGTRSLQMWNDCSDPGTRN